MENIVVGRDKPDVEKYSEKGTAFIGRNIVGSGEEAHLTNPILMDVIKPHVVLVCGKRGTGKSYTAGVIAEEMTKLPKEIKDNLSILIIDTMGIFWSMKNPNDRDKEIVKKWNLKPEGVKTVLFVPKKYAREYRETGIEVDKEFTLPCGELSALDWIITFNFSPIDSHGIAIEKTIKKVKKKNGNLYSIQDIIDEIKNDKETEKTVKNALVNRFTAANGWGLFEREGTPISDIFKSGTVNVIDVSHYLRISGAWSVRNLLVGLLARKIFMERLKARKAEEFETMTGMKKDTVPMAWIMIDEAHQFVGKEKTAATEPLLTLIKEGREPGISLLMITQRPGKLHEDALAQSDFIISHRLTARADIEALRSIMQTYMLKNIEDYINALPRQKGAAVILDDNSERLYAIQIKPRISWHAGGSPSAIKDKKLL